MKLLVDMNLSPDWIPALVQRRWDALHWSEVGPADAPDAEVFAWARKRQCVVVTQDLDFSQLLFAMASLGPSLVLLRFAEEFNPVVRERVLEAIAHAEAALVQGALLVVSDSRVRLRMLPIVM